jgi:hypothetical protein
MVYNLIRSRIRQNWISDSESPTNCGFNFGEEPEVDPDAKYFPKPDLNLSQTVQTVKSAPPPPHPTPQKPSTFNRTAG